MKGESKFGASESQIEREFRLGLIFAFWELISTKGTKSCLAQ